MTNRCRSTVSTQLETSKILMGIGNSADVSVFHDFREGPSGPSGILIPNFGGLYLNSNYARRFPQNRRIAKQGPMLTA
jgi:hypothetical protein